MFLKRYKHTRKTSNQGGTGGAGEDIAANHIKKCGYKVIERNWYNEKGKRIGEIDIIARKGNKIVFIEVKTRSMKRSDTDPILPEEAITKSKLHKLNKIAHAYIREKEYDDIPWQIDAITVLLKPEEKPTIKHLESIYL